MSALRLGFILCSPRTAALPSTRITVLNVLPLLAQAGMACEIVYEPAQASEMPPLDGLDAGALAARCDIVIFQKVRGAAAEALARDLRRAGVATITMICDRIDTAMAEITDATVVVTDYLKSLYPATLAERIHVVHDGIEHPAACKQSWSQRGSGWRDPLQAVLVTSDALARLPVLGAPPPWMRVRIVGNYPSWPGSLRLLRTQWHEQDPHERLDWLRFLLHPRIARVAWGADSVYRDMAAADIGILPIAPGQIKFGVEHHRVWQRKSENRLTLKMSMGLAVVATPIPAYEAVIEHGVNGMFANSPADWRACLEALRDPARRRAMGEAARASVSERYSMARQAALLIAVLQRAGALSAVAATAPAPH